MRDVKDAGDAVSALPDVADRPATKDDIRASMEALGDAAWNMAIEAAVALAQNHIANGITTMPLFNRRKQIQRHARKPSR